MAEALNRRALLVGGGAIMVSSPVLAQRVMDRLTIVTQAGVRHTFTLELALTPDQRSRGLMFRREMPADRGMLFDFGEPEQPISMWMKNTYLSLDMVFIRSNGLIHHIAENTTPLSEAIIPSNGPIRGVLEVLGGTAARLGFKAGDLVEHPSFTKT